MCGRGGVLELLSVANIYLNPVCVCVWGGGGGGGSGGVYVTTASGGGHIASLCIPSPTSRFTVQYVIWVVAAFSGGQMPPLLSTPPSPYPIPHPHTYTSHPFCQPVAPMNLEILSLFKKMAENMEVHPFILSLSGFLAPRL